MMARLRTLVLLLMVTAVGLWLLAGPALATQSAPPGPADNGKFQFPQTAHDRIGLIILGVGGVYVLAAGINALRQLKGKRPQARGRVNWR